MAELTAAILKMTQLLEKLAEPAPAPDKSEQILESLATNISEFAFDPEDGVTFDKWFRRYEDMFEKDAAKLKDDAKVRLLLRKLDTNSHSRYCNFILPKLPKDVNFKDTVATLRKIFGTYTSIFNKRFQCLQLEKSEADDVISYGGKVNRACEDIEFQKLKIDQFKCLIFICGLKSPRYADIRARLLSRIEAETPENPVTLQTLIDEYQRLVNLKVDTTLVERPMNSQPAVQSVQEKPQRSSRKDKKTPPYPCWKCGQMHFIRECTFAEHVCQSCNRVGHKEGYCKCVSRSSSSSSSDSTESDHSSINPRKPSKKQAKARSRAVFTVNQVAAIPSNRKFVPVNIDGVATQHQFNSASDVTGIAMAARRKSDPSKLLEPAIQAIHATHSVLKQPEQIQTGREHPGKIIAVLPDFKPGETVFTLVRRSRTRQWKSATIIERVEHGKYNVLLSDSHRLVRRSTAELKTDDPISHASVPRTPLSILFEEFGMSVPPVPERTKTELKASPAEQFSSTRAEEEVPTKPTAGFLQLLPRFNLLATRWLKGGDVPSPSK